MEFLPDDIWHKVLQIGIETNRLDHTDLCSLAIVNSHFDRLTRDPALWDRLIRRDFLLSFLFSFRTPSKGLYRNRYERRKERISYDWSILRIDLQPLPTPPAWNSPICSPIIIGDDRWTRYENCIQDLHLQRTSYSRSSQSNFSNSATRVNSGQQSNLANVAIGGFGGISSFFEEGGLANQPILTRAKKQYYEKKPKRPDKSSKPKAIPNSKLYIPMNRPPRRSMPRKI